MLNAKIKKTYPKHNELNPDKLHNNYERWQQEKFGNILEDSEQESDDSMDDILDDFLNND